MATSPETEHPVKAFGWAAKDTSGIFSPFKFSRRATGEHDVQLRILYCGVCHSDLHMAKNELGFTQFPMVPGHEIVGIVTEVGSKVKKCKVGDRVGVGCLVGSCRQCDLCDRDLENYCAKQILTYSMPYYDGTITQGGYSDIMVADEHFVILWPDNFPLDAGAPLLCAGVTTVTVISTSISKKEEAIGKLGADEFLVSSDPEQMQAAIGTLDGIIDTVSATHSLYMEVSLLKPEGKLILVGLPQSLEIPIFPLLIGRRAIIGSATGGLKETQEMIDFAAKHNILPEVEMIPMDYVNTAMERLFKSDVKYRFVIDIANTLKAE
ncbi:UNVERIFIED_CONTAM: Geraniol dehydrogenase 1 [Sesamum calycinum]|uniref:Geraniol dehydrogenase 1 n=1 Tax=Sesamum calycinum TaxID=2727403 RepID=A0AAW2QJ96_9LAMI